MNKYLKNAIWLFTGRLLQIYLYFLVGAYVARYLGPKDFGLFNYGTSILSFLTCIVILGFENTVVKSLVKEPDKTEEVIGTAFILRIFSGLAVLLSLIAFLACSNLDFLSRIIIFLVCFSYLFWQPFDVLDYYFQSKSLSKYTVIAKTTAILISSAIKIAIISYGLPILYFALLTVLESMLIALFYTYFYQKQKLKISKLNFSINLAKNLLQEAFPLVLAGLLLTVNLRIDQIMIHNILGDQELGIYSAGIKLSEMCYFIPVFVISSMFPSLIEAKKNNLELYYKQQQKFYRILVLQSLIIAIFVSIFSGFIIKLLYGNQYIEATLPLAISIWAGIFISIDKANEKILTLENKASLVLICRFLGAVSNILLNLILIPKLGISGASIATVISYFISAFLAIIIRNYSVVNIFRSEVEFS